MELKIKKRIIGFLLLLAIGLIVLPLFLGRSITSNELQLSNNVPERPPTPAELQMDIPAEEATVANVQPVPVPQSTSNKPAPSRIVFEQVSPASDNTVSAASKSNQPLFPAVPSESTAPVSGDALPATASLPAPDDSIKVPTTTSKSNAHKPVAKAAPQPAVISSPETVTTSAVKAAPQKVSTTKAESWVVQMGSFSEKANAEALMKKIQAMGYPSYLTTSQTAKGTSVRVFAGPELQKSTAQAMQSKLMQALNVNGMVVKTPRS